MWCERRSGRRPTLALEQDIVRLVEESGPQTGSELRETLGASGFRLWQTCMCSDRLAVRRVGQRYLRLDKKVGGYARLSPSILREFFTYSVAGLASDPAALETRADQLAARIKQISAAKLRLAKRVITEIGGRVAGDEEGDGVRDKAGSEAGPGAGRGAAAEELFCVLLAGDIVYEMGHDAPRPERSTGTMVRGSDIDLVVIVDDKAPEELAQKIDDAIYEQKYRYLINPSIREEIDYVIKPLERVRGQAEFDTFKNMVPCKILDEAEWLYGSRSLAQAAKGLLVEHGVTAKLAAMEEEAVLSREEAECDLLTMNEESMSDNHLHLFYPTEESDEFD